MHGKHRLPGSKRFRRLAAVPVLGTTVGLLVQTLSGSASALPVHQTPLLPGVLVYSSSAYLNAPHIVPGVTQLPPGCTPGNCVTATASGAYPYVFNNDLADASFGVTSPILLNQMAPSGFPLGTIEVPNSDRPAADGDQMVTSFSSKSELALNLSTSGKELTFMGYEAPLGTLDASNSNTPGVIDPTDPVPSAYYRVVAALGEGGKFSFTDTNAYSGNNGRAAILNDSNGANPQPLGVVLGAGAQWITPTAVPESA
ncbi:MAG: hypothetical protein ACRDJU_00165 [Actinomycetota bacterium]